MVIVTLAFYAFAAVLVAAAAMVVLARNPVHAVLYLILAFFNAAALFLLAGAEFLAMILVIVYVGAVAVLFLFVVMMLDVNFAELREGFVRYLPIGAVIGLVLAVELLFLASVWSLSPEAPRLLAEPIPPGLDNTRALGRVLYTDYLYLFQASGVILLVAMIGAIVLTLRDRPGVKRQDIAAQTARRPVETLAIVKMKPGSGMVVVPKPDATTGSGRDRAVEPTIQGGH
ncbi:MAG: NADH-quinone oxidoreductase subunit J [Elioraea sp.]|nr:NADH-quinone oxidoreductase subunit J [Elioraea sp.]